MTTPVILALKVTGADQAKDLLKSIRQATIDTERATIAQTASGARERVAILRAEVNERIALARRLRQEEQFHTGIGRSMGGVRGALTGTGSPFMGSFGGGGGGGGGGELVGLARGAGAAGIAIQALKAGLDLATEALKRFGSFVLTDVIRPAFALETRAVQIANSSGGKLTPTEIQTKARAAGIRNNMDPMAMVEAAGVFQDLSGQPGMAFNMVGSLATIAKGRGFDLGELTKMAGAIYNADRTQSQGDVEKVLLKMIHQGDTGSITLGEMARLQGKAVAPSRMLAGDFGSRVGMTGALMQAARGGMGSAADTAQAMRRFLSDSLIYGEQFSAKAFTREGGARKISDPVKLIGDIFRKTGGDEATLKAAHYAVNARAFIGALDPTYKKAYEEAGGKGRHKEAMEAGAEAVERFIRGFTDGTATMQSEEQKRNAVMKTSGEKWDTAMNQIKDKLLMVMPTAQRFVDDFAAMAPKVAEAAVTLAHAMIWAADVIHSIMEAFAPSDEKGGGDPGRRGRYVMNLETGKFEFKGDLDEPGRRRGQDRGDVVGVGMTLGLQPGERAKVEPMGIPERPAFGGALPPSQGGPMVATKAKPEAPAEHAKALEGVAAAATKLQGKLEAVNLQFDQLSRNRSFYETTQR